MRRPQPAICMGVPHTNENIQTDRQTRKRWRLCQDHAACANGDESCKMPVEKQVERWYIEPNQKDGESGMFHFQYEGKNGNVVVRKTGRDVPRLNVQFFASSQ